MNNQTSLAPKPASLVLNGEHNKFGPLSEPFATFSEYDLNYIYKIKSIRRILPWFIITFGLIGNAFILMIFLRKRTKKRFSSNAFCFCALAISDSIALVFMLMRSMLKLHILNNLTLSCKLIKFIYHVSLQISSWCLVLLTLDRLIAVMFIFKYNKWSKKFHVVFILIAIVMSIILINLHLVIFVKSELKQEDIYDYTTTKRSILIRSTTTTVKPVKFKPKFTCGVDSSAFPFYSKYIYTKWDIYHAIIYGALPFILILTANIIIILKLTFLKNVNFIKTQMGSTKSLDKIDQSFRSMQVTIMLLSVALVFLIFTSPISIYMTIFYQNLASVKESKKEYIKAVLRYIGYFNNAINFYVYICLSSEFRKEFVSLFRNCMHYKPLSSTVTRCTTSTTLGSNDNLQNTANVKLPPRTKPIVRRPLKFTAKQKYNVQEQQGFTQPFIENNAEDAVEQFKQNTKQAKLVYYKMGNEQKNEKFKFTSKSQTFINSDSTYV